jgi:hypothetical protein
VILALAVAAACSDGPDVRAAIKSQIRDTVSERTRTGAQSVTCPEDVELKTGTRFSCAAVLPGGATIPIRVEMTNTTSYELDWAALDRWKVESQLASAMASEWPGLEPRDARCPPEAAPGASLRCTVVILQGVQLEVTVSIADDRRIAYTPHGVLQLAPLEQQIVDRLAADDRTATADCGGQVRYAPPHASFSCGVRYDDGRQTEAVVTVKDWDGNVAWVVR